MRRLLSLSLTSVILTLATPAWADIVSPENEACEQAKVGDSCSYEGTSGTCEDSMCCRPTPEGEDCSACLKCAANSEDSGCAAAPSAPNPSSLLLFALLGAGVLFGARRRP